MNGFRNYTKDYHTDIMFKIHSPNNAKVVRLEPEHEGSISDEYYALMSQSQLGMSAAWQEVAAKGELAERLRQAEVEQRKFPILRSVIESPDLNTKSDFHFIISPRQHVEERPFRIPLLMSPYTIKRRLESVPYNVSAYFLVPVGKKNLNIDVTACYREYGKPERNCSKNMINVEDDMEKKITLNIELPDPDSKPEPDKDCHISKVDIVAQPPKPAPPKIQTTVTETTETQTKANTPKNQTTVKQTTTTVKQTM
jgi:hypothetical protein